MGTFREMESDTVKRKIILASASPRRRELLAQIDVEFEVRVSDKEEIYHSCKPEEIVKELALMKRKMWRQTWRRRRELPGRETVS